VPNQVAEHAAAVREVTCTGRDDFFRNIQGTNQPAVIRGAVKNWPAATQGAAGPGQMGQIILPYSRDQQIDLFDGAPQGRFFYDEPLTGFNFARKKTTLSALFDRLQTDRDSAYYAGAINVPTHIPGFAEKHQNPLLGRKEEMLVSVWLGTRSRIPLHWDLPENIACVAAGRRAFTLFPMTQLENLYIGPLDRTIAGQPCSLVDFHDIDSERFPNFSDALPHALYTELSPGDAIYIPSMWLHHVESLETFGMLVNFWWREGPPHLITPMSTMMHALLSLRGMPAPERAAWKVLFDHYLFGDQEKALAHIPAEARGLWGDLSPAQLKQLRHMLGSRLMS